MQASQHFLMQQLIKMLTPSSPAFGNTVPFKQSSSFEDLISTLKPGDIIFSRTDSSLYQLCRKFINIQYDHVAVVLNPNELIHISPPIICKLGIKHIVNKARQPLILRPNIQDIQKFLTILHNFLGEKYNISALPQILMKEISCKMKIVNEKLPFSVVNQKYSRICTDAILYSLCKSSKEYEANINEDIKETTFSTYGYLLPDDLIKIIMKHSSEIIHRTPFQHSYQITDQFYSSAQVLAEKTIQITSFTTNVINNIEMNHKNVALIFSLIGKAKQFSQLYLFYQVFMLFRRIFVGQENLSSKFDLKKSIALIFIAILSLQIGKQKIRASTMNAKL